MKPRDRNQDNSSAQLRPCSDQGEVNQLQLYTAFREQETMTMDGWSIYGLTVVALFIKMFSAVLVQGYGRYQHRGFNNPEDAVMFEKFFGQKPDAAQRSELVDRAQSVLRNDGENIPIFLFIAVSYLQLGCWEQ